MSAQTNELFDIIRSLTPQEKTFFKAYFLKAKEEEGTPSFLLLFDAMNEMEFYDKHELKLILTKKGFKSNYFKAQTYLTEAILSALTKYHSETENSIKLGNLLQEVNILIKKNLFHTAHKYFDKAQKMANAHTMYEYQLLLDYVGFHFHEKKQAWVDKYMLSVNAHLKEFGLETELRKAGFDALNLAIEHYDKHASESMVKKNASKVLEKLNYISKNLSLNNFSKSRYYSSKIQCLMILNNSAALNREIKEYSQYLKSLPNTNAFFARTVLHGYNSIVIALANMRDFSTIERTFSAAETYFHSLSPKTCTPDISSLYYSYIVENMLAIFNETGLPEKTLNLWEENKNEIHRYGKKNSVSLCAMNVALGQFMQGDFHKAVRLANTIPYEPVRPTVYCEANLLLLLSHYELNNIDILPSLAKQARRSYDKCNILKEEDSILFNFFEKKIVKLNSKQEKAIAFAYLKQSMEACKDQAGADATTGSIKVDLWLDSKIKDMSYAELVQKSSEG